MFPTATPSTSKRENYPISTPLNQVYPQESVLNSSGGNFNIQTVNNNNQSAQVGTARTYKTRERLYYETDYVKAPNSPVNNVPSSSSTANSSSGLFEPFLRKQPGVGGAAGEDVNTEELPPTASLHDNLLPSSVNITSNPSHINTGSPMVINGVIGSPMKKSSQFNNATQWSSVFVSGGPQQMTRSITVFGFPPNCRNDILVSFQSHGNIESFDGGESVGINAANSGNWIHIVYESEWAAQKALSRNGSIFQPIGVMIGVIPMQMAIEKVNSAADSFMSPIKIQKSSMTSTIEPESIFARKETSSKKSDETSLSNLPDESSIVTKAVNYIFGW